MTYAKVENGQVVETQKSSPKNTKITSNFYLLPDEEKKTQGWYNVVPDATELTEWQVQKPSEYVYDANTDEVSEVKKFDTLSVADHKVVKIDVIKNNTKVHVLNTYPDYKQLSAGMGIYDDATNATIRDFVKAHVDEVLNVETQINAANTHAAIAAFDNVVIVE